MHRVHLLALCVVGALALTGCPKKPANGECKSSADCAEQAGYGKVCVEGRCQECSTNSDCKAGFACESNKCVPPAAPAKATCDDATCPAGQGCVNGACAALPEGTCRKNADCGDGECVNGACKASVSADCADAAAFTVVFGFDQSTLTSDAQGSLQKLSQCLKAAPAKRVVCAGYADERGTAQYNIALGSRRAESAKKYLADLGAAGTVDTVSYGEENPVCTEATEACWARNRRVEFKIER
ncbi:MAG: OmpA family protein [Anaeromyxobacter sp.]